MLSLSLPSNKRGLPLRLLGKAIVVHDIKSNKFSPNLRRKLHPRNENSTLLGPSNTSHRSVSNPEPPKGNALVAVLCDSGNNASKDQDTS